jgi:predicted RNA-binding Zn ribbon-like protein
MWRIVAMDRSVALELANTIRHDGSGGVTDELSHAVGMTAWVHERVALFEGGFDVAGFTADEDARERIVAVRQAVRALFARAVRPGPPNSADAAHLLPAVRALEVLNESAACVPFAPQLVWAEDVAPSVHLHTNEVDEVLLLNAALARAAIEFLAGPQRERLRACPAPRCVRYFVKEHGKQEWCKASCGNRARAARHYQRHRPTAPTE